MPQLLEIQLLGACHVTWREQPLALRRRQVRALLYRLAVQATPLARGQLAFLFWPDEPDAVARRNLTRLLSALRAELPEPCCLLIDEETVALNVTLVTVDARHFTALCATRHPAQLAEAVTLYSGPLMAGFSLDEAPEYDAWQAEAARQLHTLFLDALEHLTEHAIAAGDNAAAIRYAQQYLAADELAEPMHRRLIALYVAAGDRGAALRQLDRCTIILERELGVSPLPETRAALSHTPTAIARPVVPVLPSLDLPLAGRAEVLARLHAEYDRLARHGGVILIHGESGMGKSRLLQEFVARHQGLTLAGTFHTDGHTLPYAALIQALRATLTNQNLWGAVPAHWRSELLPLLPELRAIVPGTPVPLPIAASLARQHLYTALNQTFRAFAGNGTIVLCLDDLHLADGATLNWLRSLAAHWNDVPLVIMAAATTITREIDALRQILLRAGRLAELTITGISLPATHQLMAVLPHTPPAELAARIHAITGGNPFFILETLRELQERGQLTDPPADLPLPATIREALLTRIAHVGAVARQLLEAAAILDPLLDDRLLQQIAARTAAEIVDGLDELIAHQLLRVVERGNNTPALTFPHGLLRNVILQSLTPWRRKLLHRRAHEALARFRPHLFATLARHAEAAEDWAAAVNYYQQAAIQAREMYAFTIALTHLDAAFALLDRLPPSAALRRALLRQRLMLRRTLIQIPEWQADTAELLRLAIEAHDHAARLDALEARISLHVLQSNFDLVEQTANEALELATRTGDRGAQARIHHTIGWHLADALGRSREGLAHLQTACDLARETGNHTTLYHSLCNLAFAQRAEGRCAAARASAEQALQLAGYRADIAPHATFADALRELGEANAYLGRWEEMRRQLQPLLELYRTLDDPWAYGTLLYNYGLYSSNMGQHDDAIDAMRRLVALSSAVGLPAKSDYGIWHRAGLARVLIAAGNSAEAGALLHSLHTESLTPGRPYLAWAKAVAEYHLATSDPAAALASLDPAVTWWRTHPGPHDADLLLLLAQAALTAGDAARATTAVAEAAAHLANTDMYRYHLRLAIICAHISGTSADRAAAEAELARQAALFNDDALREAFLRRVPLHATLHDDRA